MNKNIIKIFVCIVAAFGLSSCSHLRVVSYNLQSLDDKGVATKQNMTVKYEDFNVIYDVYGGCRIQNNTNKTMYVDLGESYVVKDGLAQRIYSNSVITDTKSNSDGSSVNLGAITGALGIGGFVGNVASGINVGGGTSKGKSVQTMEERYISIPPQSTRIVKFTKFVLSDELPSGRGEHNLVKFDACEHLLTYTFDPEGKNFHMIRNELYINKVEIGKGKFVEYNVSKRIWPKYQRADNI